MHAAVERILFSTLWCYSPSTQVSHTWSGDTWQEANLDLHRIDTPYGHLVNRTSYKVSRLLFDKYQGAWIWSGNFFLCSVCAIACLVTVRHASVSVTVFILIPLQYAIWPQRFIFMGLYFALSKRMFTLAIITLCTRSLTYFSLWIVYVNSLLASLNTRQSFRAKTHKNDTSEEFTSASLAFPRVKPDHNQGEPKQDLEHSTQVQSRTSSESRNTWHDPYPSEFPHSQINLPSVM